VEGTHVATEGKNHLLKALAQCSLICLDKLMKKELPVSRGKLYHMTRRFSITSAFKPVPILEFSKQWLIISLSHCRHDIGSKTRWPIMREYRYYLIIRPSW